MLSSLPPTPPSLTHTTCGHLSWLQAHISSLRQVSVGSQDAGRRRLCFQSRALGENCQPGATAQTTVSSVPTGAWEAGPAMVPVYGREEGGERTGWVCAQGRTLVEVRAGTHTGSSELLAPAPPEGQPQRPSPLVPSWSCLRPFCTSGPPVSAPGPPVFQNAPPAVSRAPPAPL